jgi:hypothetical protein
MIRRSGALALLLAAVACAPAVAKQVPVNVRIEGQRSTLFEGRLLARVHKVDSGDGTGGHTCDGTNGGANSTPAPTLLGAFDQAVRSSFLSWSGAYSTGFQDFTIDRVGPDSSDTKTNRYWGQALNFKDTQLGGCQIQVKSGDQVLIAFNSFGHPKLKLAGPRQVAAARPFTVTVFDGEKGKPVAGAIVRGRSTGPRGRVRLTLPEEGTYRFKARAKDAIRSNALTVHAS